MNDYILYNELGSGSHAKVYKGRKKGQIDFVAICSYEKTCEKYVQNKVSILNNLKHPNIIDFYDWYETSSHFWVIEELCNGCSLAMAMAQDCPVPERLIRNCAIQLARALYQIHCHGVVVRNLHPQKVFINSKGQLKLGGMLMAVDLNKPAEESVTPALSPLYCCPEALTENIWSYSSDLWSLGGILYHMATGREPFPGSTVEEILDGMNAEVERRRTGDKRIPTSDEQNKHLSLPSASADGSPFSDGFISILTGLLDPSPETRLTWTEIQKHHFFVDEDDEADQISFFTNESCSSLTNSVEQNFPDSLADQTKKDNKVTDSQAKLSSTTNFKSSSTQNKPDVSEATTTASVSTNDNIRKSLPQNRTLTNTESSDLRKTITNAEELDLRNTLTNKEATRIKEAVVQNNRTFNSGGINRNDFNLDNRQSDNDNSITITESMVQMPEIKMEPNTASRRRSSVKERKLSEHTVDMTPRIQLDASYHPSINEILLQFYSTLNPQPIAGNSKIFKENTNIRWDARGLPWEPLSNAALTDCDSSEISHHLAEIADFLGKRREKPKDICNALGYVFSLSGFETCVYLIVNSGVLLTLVHLVKGSNEEIQTRIVKVIGNLIQNSTTIEIETQLGECVQILTDMLRDSSRSQTLRLHTLASLGELIFFISSQEESDGVNPDWSIPSSTFVCITRCLREGEDILLQLCAAKVIENVATTRSQYTSYLTQDHVALAVWKLHMKQAATDTAYITFMRALVNMTALQPSLLSHVVTKIGLVNVVNNLNKSQPHLQKEILRFLLHGLNVNKPTAATKRIIADRPLLSLAIAMVTSQYSLVKSFSVLLVSRLLGSSDALSSACDQKLIQNLDKELKKASDEYTMLCLMNISRTLINFIPSILEKGDAVLRKVEGRRNPNTTQLKELNSTLTALPIVLHLLTSRALAANALAVIDLNVVGDILKKVPSIQNGDTGLGSGTLGDETLSVLFSIAEICLPVMEPRSAIPILGVLCCCQGEYRGATLQLGIRVSEKAVQSIPGGELRDLYSLHILPKVQEMLLETPPIPTLSLKLILPILHSCPDLELEEHGIVTALVELMKDLEPEYGTCFYVLEVLAYTLNTNNVDFPWLYSIGLPEQLSLLVLKLGVAADTPEETVLSAIDCLKSLLNYVMNVVKSALQSNNKTKGEEILRASQCMVNTCGVLLVWYHYNDVPILLLTITQLYGGQYKDILSPYNTDIITSALSDGTVDKAKTTLKILKRVVTTDPVIVKKAAKDVREQILSSLQTVKTAQPTLVPLADEVLKAVKSVS